jgi:lathosterol oxidase
LDRVKMSVLASNMSELVARLAVFDFGTENPYRTFNSLLNGIFFSLFGANAAQEYLDKALGNEKGYYMQSYLRDLILGTLVYWITAGVWHFVIYVVFREQLFTKKGRALPTWETIIDQMCLAQSSLLIYAMLPILSEYLIESGMTRTYFYVQDIGGWSFYFGYLLLYFAFFEFGIYWMHRTLHTNKFLYKYVHALHHKYNKPLTLTPWASIAFNPLDGILQACPYVIGLFIVPVHYLTHVFLLFFSGVWATNIHDAMWGNTEPIMGSKYHTMHHTHYHCNFGQFFIFCDYIFGTLKLPEKTKFD